jgi:Na+-transporting NADH:ubiquinone oxidoreductase subunit D
MAGKGKAKRIFIDGVGKNNPVFVQILGICSTLAVTNRLENTVVMSIGVIFVLTFSNLVVSLLRKYIPGRVRMMAETLIIASFVIIVDITLRAYMPEIWQALGPYVGLIITNCIIMGRAEAFGMNNPPRYSIVDGFAAGIGYSYVLIGVAIIRELLGTGELWGITIFGDWWTNWAIMVMPPGAFFMLAIFVWFIKSKIIPESEEAQ